MSTKAVIQDKRDHGRNLIIAVAERARIVATLYDSPTFRDRVDRELTVISELMKQFHANHATVRKLQPRAKK